MKPNVNRRYKTNNPTGNIPPCHDSVIYYLATANGLFDGTMRSDRVNSFSLRMRIVWEDERDLVAEQSSADGMSGMACDSQVGS